MVKSLKLGNQLAAADTPKQVSFCPLGMQPNSTDSLNDWSRFRQHLSVAAVEEPVAVQRADSLAPGVLYVDTRPVPQGFSDLTQLMAEKGVPLAAGVRVGVEPNSMVSRTICDALFALAP